MAGSVVSRTMSSRSAFLRGSSVHDRPLFHRRLSGVVERPGRSPAPASVGGNGSTVSSRVCAAHAWLKTCRRSVALRAMVRRSAPATLEDVDLHRP